MKQLSTKTGTKIRTISSGRSSVFLVSNDQTNLLIDTGPAFIGSGLLKKLERLHINSIDFLILTHTHFDHAANACKLKKKYGLKVIVHESEAGFLLSGDSPVPAGTNALTKWLSGTFGKWTEKMVRYHSCEADILVQQEFDLSFTGINAQVVHTPGHSTGSQSLIVDNEIALVGDTFFGTYPGSCFPPFADDEPEVLKSWEKMLSTDCQLFLPSHGRVRTRQMVVRKLEMEKKKRLLTR